MKKKFTIAKLPIVTFVLGACLGILGTLEFFSGHEALQVDRAIVSASEALDAKDIVRAKLHLHTAAGLAPDNYLPYELYGDILVLENRPSSALTMYRQALRNTDKEQLTTVQSLTPNGTEQLGARHRIEEKITVLLTTQSDPV